MKKPTSNSEESERQKNQGSGLDPYSIGPVDPDPDSESGSGSGGQK